MIHYLIDSSALWRVLREDKLRAAWADVITSGSVGSCHPQRLEFKRSARNSAEHETMGEMFTALYPDVSVHKSAWQWTESAQHRLTQRGQHQALSVVDLLVSATAAHHGLVVLHDDNDFETVARVVKDMRARRVQSVPA